MKAITDETLRRIDAHRARRVGELLDEQTANVAPQQTAAAKTTIAEQLADLGLDGAQILADVERLLMRFVSYPSEHARVAHVLWIGHAHLIDYHESTPRLAFLSPEPASGKSRSLEVTELLVPRPVAAVNATPAYLFRKVSDPAGTPTVLFDEIDTVFGPKARENEELRGLLNAGHRKGAMAGRCVIRGKEVLTEELPAYCAVAMAGLGSLPDTILSRSIIVRMRRRAPTETIEPFRRRLHEPEGYAIRDRLAAWAKVVAPALTVPDMPAGVADRSADVWEAPLAVADAAGGEWPARGRVAAVTLVTDVMAGGPTFGVQLLTDIKTAFGDRDRVSTTDLLHAMCEMEEAPWGDLKGKPLDARRLSKYLRPYGINSRTIRIGAVSAKGYMREDLHDAWLRYLPRQAAGSVTTVTTDTRSVIHGEPGADCPF